MTRIGIKVIKPKPLKAGAMRKAILENAQRAADAMAKDMDRLTQYWSNPVKFVGKIKPHRDNIELIAKPVSPRSKWVRIMGYIDKGTKGDYLIPKPGNKKAKTLFFSSQHKAGSKPNSVTVGASSSGPRDTRRKRVTHPGIKPRNWTKLRIAEWRRTRKLSKFGLEAMKTATKVSGHAIK